MSGLKINFHKSELMLFGKAKKKQDLYQEILTCKMGVIPIKYLGMLVSDSRHRNKLLGSIAGRITLVQACLTNIPLFMMYFYPIPKGVIKKVDFYRARLVWQEDDNI